MGSFSYGRSRKPSSVIHLLLKCAKEGVSDKVICMTYGTFKISHCSLTEPVVHDKLTEGGKVKCPLEPTFWGALFGQIEDKYGIVQDRYLCDMYCWALS